MDKPIYRDWNRGQLDAQLNLRARWPEHAVFFEKWAATSRKLREDLPVRTDLAYGSSSGERLDLFVPEGAQEAPLHVFIHGGYWQSLDKSDFSFLAPDYLERGIAFASLNYDLAPKARVGEMVMQVRRAVAWLHRNAGKHRIDAGRIFVSGHSAGGHLAAMTLLSDWAAFDLPADTVKGVCAVSGIYELEPIRLSYHQPVVQLTPEDVDALSPLRNQPASATPLVLAVGGEETEEFHLQQAELAERWSAAGVPLAEISVPGRHHFDIVEDLGDPGQALGAAMFGLIQSGAVSA
ncbi:MAG: alpha/beta hydrolase [Rhodovibrionaceae bacterium]|nr:alpha/beta hydrolase [Rhodovibrionaceae bacterium]